MPALPIIHAADGFLVIDKPAGMPVIPARDGGDCVLAALGRQLKLPVSGDDDARLRVVHRLDRDTSGVLLFATTLQSQRWLTQCFETGSIHKEYLALVAGVAPADDGLIDAPLAEHLRRKPEMCVSAHGKPSRTRWCVEERLGSFTVIRVFPQTGRTHQIRVHLAHVGMPLAVDPLYAARQQQREPGLFLSDIKRGYKPSRGMPERPLISRLTLHAARLSFDDPAGHTHTFSSPLPHDFSTVLKQLRKHR